MSAALLATGALLLFGAHGGGHTPTPTGPSGPTTSAPAVTMSAQAFLPREVVALVGEDVTWTNTDARNHTVTDSDESDAETFDSGTLLPAATFLHSFAAQGTYSYRCTIHRFMTGTVRVFGLALDPPPVVLPGRHARFNGRAPAGTTDAVLERRHEGAFEVVAPVVPAADGTYVAEVHVHEPGAYRVRAGELTSPLVRVRLTAAVRSTARRTGATVRVATRVTPARAGTAVLQRYVRELFDWRSVARTRIKADGTARFALKTRDEVYLRVVASNLGGGWSAGASRAVRVPSLRP